MSVEAYKQKAQANLDEQKAAIASAKAKLAGVGADGRIEAEKQLSKLEQGYEAAKEKMGELAEAGEDAWEDFSKSVENAWDSASASLKKFFS